MAPTLCTHNDDDVILTFYFIEGQVYSAAPYLVKAAPKSQNHFNYVKEAPGKVTQNQRIFQESVLKPETSVDFTDDEMENFCQDEKTLQRLEAENLLPCIDDSVEELFGDSDDNRKAQANYDGSLASIGDSTKVLCSETASISSSYIADDFRSMESGDLPDEYPYVPIVPDVSKDDYVPPVASTPNKMTQAIIPDDYDVPDISLEDYCNNQIDGTEDKKKKKRLLSRIRKTIDDVVRSAEKSATLPVRRTPSFAYCSTSGLFCKNQRMQSIYISNQSASLSYLDLEGIEEFPSHQKKEKWWRFWRKR